MGNQMRYCLSVQLDCGWNNRGSGRSYNSDSGQSVMFGNRTKKIISCEAMSKRCSRCEKGVPHDPLLCSKNYNGSSKDMEAHASLNHQQLND